MVIRILTVTFLLVLFYKPGQGQKIDSLKQQLTIQGGQDRWGTLYDLAFEYIDKENWKEALIYIEEAQIVAWQDNDSLRIVKSGRVKGQMMRRLDNISLAIAEFERVLPISKRNKFDSEYRLIVNGLALIEDLRGNYDKALRYYFENLSLLSKTPDPDQSRTTLINIGEVYAELQDFNKALEYYERGLAIDPDNPAKYQIFVNIGFCHDGLNDFLRARDFFNRGLQGQSVHSGSAVRMMGVYGLGLVAYHLKEYDLSERYFNESYLLSLDRGDKRYQLLTLWSQARLENEVGHFSDALRHLAIAESLQAGTVYKELRLAIYEEYAKAFISLKDFKRASYYQSLGQTLTDTLFSRQLTNRLMTTQTEFEEKMNQLTIASQQTVLKIREETISKQQFINVIVGLLAIVFVSLSYVLFRLNRQRKNLNLILDRKVAERTLALQMTLQELRKSQREQEAILQNLAGEMTASVATIRGLCGLTKLNEIGVIRSPYAKELEDIAGRIAELANRVKIMTGVHGDAND